MELENSKLKETTITNHLILELVRDYINEYEFFNDSQIKPSILLKLEHSKDGQIVFLGATFLISYFESNLPDSYAKVGDIVIFIYNDGIYAIAEIPPEPPVGFSLSDYLEKNTSLNLSEYIEITINFTIDEKGKATDVEIEGIRNSYLKNEVIEAIHEMPKWSLGKIGNKVVKVRDSYGLKEF